MLVDSFLLTRFYIETRYDQLLREIFFFLVTTATFEKGKVVGGGSCQGGTWRERLKKNIFEDFTKVGCKHLGDHSM